jgi:hypothetical protein
VVDNVRAELGEAMARGSTATARLRGHGKVAWAKLVRLKQTMGKLLPQIRYWLKTGRVAANKIINLQVPELYAIVRGKAGKAVEFGLKWGIARLHGGFLLATLGKDKHELEDSKFAVRAVQDHIALFGKAPKVCVRPRRLEPIKRGGAQGPGREGRGTGSPRERPVGGQRQGQGEARERASTSRSRDRDDKSAGSTGSTNRLRAR